MCWSLEASLAAFVWCTLCAIYLQRRQASPRDVWAWKFLLAYGLVQLCDAGFWLNRALLPHHDDSSSTPHSVCESTNALISEYGLPIVLTTGVAVQIHQGIEHLLGRPLPIWTAVLLAGWILSAPSRFDLYWGPKPYCTSLLENRTLLWGDRPASTLWVVGGTISFALPFIVMRPRSVGIVYFALGAGSSALVYRMEPRAWGSNWCFIAALFSLVFIAEPYVTGIHSVEKDRVS